MAPMKFEENIKEKLVDRKINPSEDAWQRVAENLENNSVKTKNNTTYWAAIAAGFIGILIVAGGLFPDLETDNSPTVVHSKNTIKVGGETNSTEKQLEIPQNQSQITQNQPEKQLNLPKNDGKPEQNPVTPEQVILDLPVQNNQVADVNEEGNTIKAFDAAQRQTIDDEVTRLLTQVDSLARNDTMVTDAQVDALLAEAQRELLGDRIFKTQNENLSATALLQEVEDDLERSFRDKVFDALKEGLTKAREAVASRNN
ncbi:hypothetical protein [Flavimarina sp. Hel_I_48]|uniref:hypothetical protein n=1 Tax=Flavimarina sp. Hel_I_48 TaxID=1392488 RepID=UPI000A49406E|nr:hypothetical protein [Flavimarina sp. Hel_I_48]